MKQALKLVLFIGALLGLLGQTVVVAASPHTATTIEHTVNAPMPVECLGMMKGSDKHSLPCDCMTLACIAGMGCHTIFAVDVPAMAVAKAPIETLRPSLPPLNALHGRSVRPEQHPPTTLV